MRNGKNPTPPKLAKKLLSIFVRSGNRPYLLGDLEENYKLILKDRGKLFAFFWYWYQTIIPLPNFQITHLNWSLIMFKNYLKIALRNIQKNKIYSSLNIIGFAIGIAAYILIGLYVNYELSYDKIHEKSDRIYQVFTSRAATTPAPLAPTLMKEFPEVEAATRVEDAGGFLIRHGEKVFIEENWFWADMYLFDIFTFPFLKGEKSSVFDKPKSIVINEKTAEKYFGDQDPINKILTCTFTNGKNIDFTVTGVLKNIPQNSYIKGDFF